MSTWRILLFLLVGALTGFLAGAEYGANLVRTRWSRLLGLPPVSEVPGVDVTKGAPVVRARQERLLLEYRKAYEKESKRGA